MNGYTSIRAIITRHVEPYQTPNLEEPSTSEYLLLSIHHTVSKLREELESEALIGCFDSSIGGNAVSGESNNISNSMDQAEKQTLEAILEVIQATLDVVVSSKTSSAHILRNIYFYESTCQVLDFIAIFASIPSNLKDLPTRINSLASQSPPNEKL